MTDHPTTTAPTEPLNARPAPNWTFSTKDKANARRRVRGNAKNSRYWHYRPEAPDEHLTW